MVEGGKGGTPPWTIFWDDLGGAQLPGVLMPVRLANSAFCRKVFKKVRERRWFARHAKRACAPPGQTFESALAANWGRYRTRDKRITKTHESDHWKPHPHETLAGKRVPNILACGSDLVQGGGGTAFDEFRFGRQRHLASASRARRKGFVFISLEDETGVSNTIGLKSRDLFGNASGLVGFT